MPGPITARSVGNTTVDPGRRCDFPAVVLNGHTITKPDTLYLLALGSIHFGHQADC